MSPRSWTVCPKCRKERQEQLTRLRFQVATYYGKVPISEYEKLQKDLKALEEHGDGYDLAEYYEHYWEPNDIGILTLHWRYNCNCQTCGFEFQTVYHVA